MKTIGVLGGMGPEASADLFQRMLSICQQEFGAVQDTDYPSMLIASFPLTGFDETGIRDAGAVLGQLTANIQLLAPVR